jgi:hypothetical protein
MGLINIYYKTMFEMHPWPTNFKTMIDGAILKFHQDPKTSNTCASEISYALNVLTVTLSIRAATTEKEASWSRRSGRSQIKTVTSTFSPLSISANTSTTGMDQANNFQTLPKSESVTE